MAIFSFTDYEKNVPSTTSNTQQSNRNYVSYFSLKDDGDEAIVRFAYATPEDFQLVSTHNVNINGRVRKVECLRTPWDPVDDCPLCAANNRPQERFFVKMIEYTKDENGNISIVPRIWERSRKFASTLKGWYEEYNPLCDCVFKIKRHGKAGATSTTYDLIPCNPSIYNETLYKKDFSAFENYSLSSYVVLSKTRDEMVKYLETGLMPMPESPKQPNTQNNYTNVDTNKESVSAFTQDAVRPKRTYTY